MCYSLHRPLSLQVSTLFIYCNWILHTPWDFFFTEVMCQQCSHPTPTWVPASAVLWCPSPAWAQGRKQLTPLWCWGWGRGWGREACLSQLYKLAILDNISSNSCSDQFCIIVCGVCQQPYTYKHVPVYLYRLYIIYITFPHNQIINW